MNRKRKISACVGLLALIGNACASDEADATATQSLGGDYRVVITQTCVRTPYQPPPAAGFDPNTNQLLVEGEMLTATGSGLMRFSENGLVQVLEGAQTEVSLDQVQPGKTPVASTAQFTCNGTYKTEARKVTLSLTCDVIVPQPGIKVTVGPQNFEGYVDQRKRSLNLTNIAGGIQAITVLANGNPEQQRQRICTQHALAIK